MTDWINCISLYYVHDWLGQVHTCITDWLNCISLYYVHDWLGQVHTCMILSLNELHMQREAGIAQWLERLTRDRKVPSSSPGRSGGRIFFSRANFLCWPLVRYPFHPRVTAVARKRPRSFFQKCRWQVTAKHAYTLPMWFWMKWHCKLVHGWMVYTELAPRRQHFTWHQPCNTHRALPVHHSRGW